MLAVLSAAGQAATGLAEIPGRHSQELVAVFYPTESEGPPVQRWQFSLPVVEQAPPARGNGRLVVISHGSPSNPWVNADLAIALTRAGFIVAAPWHLRDNSSDSADAGPVSWKRRPQEVSAAIDTVLADPRFAPLLATDRVGAYGMSAGGHAVLTLAGGRWSPSTLRAHCLAHLEEDWSRPATATLASAASRCRYGVIGNVRTKGTAMTGLLWLGAAPGAIGALVATAIGLRTVGASRWAELIRTHTGLLESGRVGVQRRLPSPERFDARELEGLPAPVQRYFRAVLTDGQPIVGAVEAAWVRPDGRKAYFVGHVKNLSYELVP